MDLSYYIHQFSANKDVFKNLLQVTSQEHIHWKQSPEKWNLLEIACHLADEESEDFRTRLRIVLEDTQQPFPSIDPQGWVTLRNYNEQNFEATIEKFMNERHQSLQWLQTLANAEWSNVYQHPTIGAMSATLILANWLAHDYLHIRQITKLKYDYLHHVSKENLAYAGNW